MSTKSNEYRAPHPDMTPSLLRIQDEPVWAEIARWTDLSTVYITAENKGRWHVWIAWAVDDPKATEFISVIPLTDDGVDPITFSSYDAALRMATGLATTVA